MKTLVYELFGEILVTKQEIDEWMRTEAPNISTLRTKEYVIQLNVIEKIKQAKIKGESKLKSIINFSIKYKLELNFQNNGFHFNNNINIS